MLPTPPMGMMHPLSQKSIDYSGLQLAGLRDLGSLGRFRPPQGENNRRLQKQGLKVLLFLLLSGFRQPKSLQKHRPLKALLPLPKHKEHLTWASKQPPTSTN